MQCPSAPAFKDFVKSLRCGGEHPEFRPDARMKRLAKKPQAKWTRRDCAYASGVMGSVPMLDLGRLSPTQKRVYAGRRLLSPAEASERIRSRHGAAAPDLTRLPGHIDLFAEYMREASGRPVTARDVVKAYVITRSSIRRQARPLATVCRDFAEYASARDAAARRNEPVRPEDVMSRLLLSKDGKEYLDAAERGRFAKGAAKRLARKTQCFGFADTLLEDLETAVSLGRDGTIAAALRSASPETWVELVDSPAVPGIGASKAGFFAALLGRGDVPTFDAREIDLWRRHPGREPERHDVLALRERIAEFPLALEPQHEPYRQHLVHHALWDAYGKTPTETTHEEVVRAMQLAGLSGARPEVAIRVRARTARPRNANLQALCDGEDCGFLDLYEINDPEKGHYFEVGGVLVEPGHQRRGVGTRLYEAAAEYACANGGRLASTQRLKGAHSIDFWKKQIEKGRAEIVHRDPGGNGRWDTIMLTHCAQKIDLSALGAGRGGALRSRSVRSAPSGQERNRAAPRARSRTRSDRRGSGEWSLRALREGRGRQARVPSVSRGREGEPLHHREGAVRDPLIGAVEVTRSSPGASPTRAPSPRPCTRASSLETGG